tara:strand:+ start:981 stop:1535 length:555 start_codon:yes stop_codon:yes gene_type:complete
MAFLTFKLTGTKAAVRTFKKTESSILVELKRIVNDVFMTEILDDAKANTTKQLSQQSGTLRSNINTDTRILGKVVIGRLFVDLKRVPYARIHELGGIIRPKKGKFLTIPFPGIKGFARDFKDTFIAKDIIFQKTGSGIRPLFSLKKQVTIPRRSYLRPAIEKNIPFLRRTIKKEMNKLDMKEKK